jgi:hypothetical protein
MREGGATGSALPRFRRGRPMAGGLTRHSPEPGTCSRGGRGQRQSVCAGEREREAGVTLPRGGSTAREGKREVSLWLRSIAGWTAHHGCECAGESRGQAVPGVSIGSDLSRRRSLKSRREAGLGCTDDQQSATSATTLEPGIPPRSSLCACSPSTCCLLYTQPSPTLAGHTLLVPLSLDSPPLMPSLGCSLASPASLLPASNRPHCRRDKGNGRVSPRFRTTVATRPAR